MLSEFSLEGKVAIVTGAGRGIGRGIALALAEAGAAIVAVSRTESELTELGSEIKRNRGHCLPLVADVTSSEQVETIVKQTISEFNKIDILVNNAGTFVMKTFVPLPDLKTRFAELLPDFNSITTEKEWRQQMDTNTTSAFLTCRAVGPYMIQQRSGKIINVTTVDVFRANRFHVAYAASKAALAALTKQLALEWARYNINVNSIAPGFYRTSLSEFSYRDEQTRDAMLRSVPLHRFGEPRDVGLVAVFLASRASDYITGCIIPVDGGLHL
jgi:NAD(P)-dependent dehydrogenase (short-subunit alcohol dehydrogenase family)